MPASPGIKVLAQAAQVMFRRSCGAREPCMRRCLGSGEATFGDGTEDTDEVFGCAKYTLSHIRRDGPGRTFVGIIIPPSVVTGDPCLSAYRITSVM